MPTYLYRKPDGGHHEVTEPVSEMLKRDGMFDGCPRDLLAEQGERAPVKCSIWPMKSDAVGVSPAHIPAAMEASRRAGCPTEFDSRTGQAILTSPGHRRAYARSRGAFDLRAFC